jgi:hypothetical protein
LGEVVLVRAMKAYRGCIGITPFILNLVHSTEMSTQRHVLAALSLGKEPPPPRMCWTRGRMGHRVGMDNLEKGEIS